MGARYGSLSLGDVGVKRMVEEFIVYGHYRAQDHIHCNLRRSAITQIV